MKYYYKEGRSTVAFSREQKDMIDFVIKKAAPSLHRALETELEGLKKEAQEDWLVRAPYPILKKDGSIKRWVQPRSKRSKRKFRSGLRLLMSGEWHGFVENYAPYAGMIRIGPYSKTSIPLGKFLWRETMWRPARKRINNLVRAMTEDLEKAMKRR